jgi:hypothetical protein
MKIRVDTYFDCTATGTTGHFRQVQLPMINRTGDTIVDQAAWNRSRNQQRNFETLLQLIGLYTQPLELSNPVHDAKTQQWSFDFEVEFEGIFADDVDSLGLLKQQARNVPMITGLGEQQTLPRQLIPDVNIFFSELNTVN